MSLLDIDSTINYPTAEKLMKKEELYARGLFHQGGVICTIAEDEINFLVKKNAQVNNLNLNPITPFDYKIHAIIEKAVFPELKKHSSRDIISLDCRRLTKGDAYGWMSNLAKICDDQIVIVNYVTRIPNIKSDIYDDHNYVTNLLLRSWKNEDICFGDFHIDRRKMTIILTCPPEDCEILMKECGLNSYSWLGNFEEW